MKRALGMLGALAIAAGCATSTTERLRLPPLRTVARVDLSRYVGTWYEIANFPQSFQRGCTATTATYTLRADGDIDVLNRCRKGSIDGEEKSVLGRARVVDRDTNAKLEVSFFRPFWGDYWILDLSDEYSYAVVGHPSRDYLWILARTPTLPEATYRSIVARLEAQGYETSRLVRTLQDRVSRRKRRSTAGSSLMAELPPERSLLLTGATGFVGRAVRPALARAISAASRRSGRPPIICGAGSMSARRCAAARSRPSSSAPA